MNAEDVKLPGRYTVDYGKALNHYIQDEPGIYGTLTHFFDKQGDIKTVFLTGRFNSISNWFSAMYLGQELWFHRDWIIGPIESNDAPETVSDSCRCPNPVVVKAFSGIAAAGQYYDFCRCCKKERK